ncbi:MAG: TolC family protein [Arcobacteraceae bacterium]
MKKICSIFLMPLFLWSQNLEELVSLSIQNRLVESSQNSLESIQKEYESVQSGYLPKLDVGANYSTTNKETASVADKSSTAYASINYKLYDGGKKYDVYKSYESTIKSNQESHEALKNEIALNVTNYYFNYLSYIAAKDAKQKEIEQLQSQHSRLGNFLAVGSTTEDELEKIISRVEIANVDLHEIELNIQTILHNLEYIVGQKVVIDSGSSLQELEAATKEALRYDIKALEYDLQTLLSNAKSEKSGYLPTVTLDNTYSYYDKEFKNSTFNTNLDEQNIFSVNLKWNIFSFGETQNKYESKYKQYLSLKSKYEYEKNRANVDLQLALKAYDISKMKLQSAQLGLKAANSTFELVKSQYENGLVDNVAFLESLSEKYSALSVLEKSKNDLEIKKAYIIFHSGNNLIGYIQ